MARTARNRRGREAAPGGGARGEGRAGAGGAKSARALATGVLERIWQGGAYAAAALDAELARHPGLDPRDAALATELVYGVLRTGMALERELVALTPDDRWKGRSFLRAELDVAAYSIAFLDRIPPFAAVSEAVAAAKRRGGTGLGGFVNAVLRRFCDRPAAADKRAAMLEAQWASLPQWLRAALCESAGGEAEARALVGNRAVEPRQWLCLRKGEDRPPWIARLTAARPDARFGEGELSPRAIWAERAGTVAALPGAGVAWSVQEQGAQLIALAVGARPGERVLDACAGRGNKSLLLAEEVGETGAVDAADLHPGKLARLCAGAHGAARVRATYAVDWTRGSGEVPGGYDRVLVDAPCTGSGTLAHRPEIAWRLGVSDPERLAALQRTIAVRVAEQLAPGGRLVYAVCSVLEAECEGVVAALASAGLSPCPFDSAAARHIAGEAPTFRLLPHRHGTDGYFVASLVRITTPSAASAPR